MDVEALGVEKKPAGGARAQKKWPVFLVALPALALASCAVSVPDPGALPSVQEATTVATPSITPGHDADAIAGKDLPLSAGDTLQAGAPVGISDGLKDAPEWKVERSNVQGESQYSKSDGCTVATRVRSNQGALSVDGNEKASTAALFQFLDPSILPEYLRVETLPWGDGQGDKPKHQVEVLALEGNKNAGSRATAIFARLFTKAGSSAYVSVSCPDAGKLTEAKEDVMSHLMLVPPTD